MRLLFLFCALFVSAFAAAPADLAAVLKDFHTDAPKGWSFTQKTVAEGRSRVERYDAAQPEFDRWTLLKENDVTPSPEDALQYKRLLTRRSHGYRAPVLTDQIDVASAERVSDTPERATYRCKLKPGEADDKTAAFLRVTIVIHKPTATVESLEIANTAEFGPTFGVKVGEMKTVMTYSLPTGTTPSLPQAITTRLRGKAFWFKSLDADMSVTYSDFEYAGKKPVKP